MKKLNKKLFKNGDKFLIALKLFDWFNWLFLLFEKSDDLIKLVYTRFFFADFLTNKWLEKKPKNLNTFLISTRDSISAKNKFAYSFFSAFHTEFQARLVPSRKPTELIF